MTTYTAYDAADLLGINKFPRLIGSIAALAVADAAQGSLVINGTKIYKPVWGHKPVVIVQFTSEDTDDFTINSAILELFPCYEQPGEDVSGGLSADFVFGVEKFDITRGIMGETDLDTKFPTDLQNKTSAEPAPTLTLTDDYTRVWQVSELGLIETPVAIRVSITATNDKGGGATADMRAKAWIVGVKNG